MGFKIKATAESRGTIADLGDVASWTTFGSVVGLPGAGEAKGRAVYCVGRAVSHEYFDFYGVRLRPRPGSGSR